MIDESNKQKLLSALDAIDPSDLSYAEWTVVGMALKYAGADPSVWDEWSRRDPGRYHSGECGRKWRTFNGGSGSAVGIGSIFKMARDQGWSFVPETKRHALGWDSIISDDGDGAEGAAPPVHEEPSKLAPGEELARYLEAVFKPEEHVAYVVEASQNGKGKWVPSGRGSFDRTAAQLIESLRKHPNDLSWTIGDTEPEAGAWIRINPCDGMGIKGENVAAYRHVLVESDEMPIADQWAAYRRLNLPIAALVNSGGKSLHAVVRVDAADAQQYRERANALYEILASEGFSVDTQNKNPLRLSRMPGVDRNGRHQALVAVNTGAKSWAQWIAERQQEELPPVCSFTEEVFENPPALAPAIIDGVLRQGHKMIISGDSKAGKSWMLIQLSAALAEGSDWLGYRCERLKVLYVNLEIQGSSFVNRIVKVYGAMGLKPSGNFYYENLRGRAQPLDKLAPVIISMIKQVGAGAVIIDPIYKIITGDENNASDMGVFCNEFDKIAQDSGAAVIYSHHHTKGLQGMKKAIDRGSGSGVFARDPDAIIDITAIDMGGDEDEHNQPRPLSFESEIGGDGSEVKAFQVSFCLREFPSPAPFNVIFEFPIFKRDTEGITANRFVEGDPRNNLKQARKSALTFDDVRDAYHEISNGDGVTKDELSDYLGCSEATINKKLHNNKSSYYMDKGKLFIKDSD